MRTRAMVHRLPFTRCTWNVKPSIAGRGQVHPFVLFSAERSSFRWVVSHRAFIGECVGFESFGFPDEQTLSKKVGKSYARRRIA